MAAAKPATASEPEPAVESKTTVTPESTNIVEIKPTTLEATSIVKAKPAKSPEPTDVVKAQPSAPPEPIPAVETKSAASPEPTAVAAAEPTSTPEPAPAIETKPAATAEPAAIVEFRPTTLKPTSVVKARPAQSPEPTDVVEAQPATPPESIPAVQAESATSIEPTPVAEAKPAATPELAATAKARPTRLEPTAVVKAQPATPGPAADAEIKPANTPEPAPVAEVQPVTPEPTRIVEAELPAPAVAQPAQTAVQPARVAPPSAPLAAQPAPAVAAPAPPATQPAPIGALPQPVAARPAVMPPMERSPAMVATLARVDQRVRHAIQLAEKGALYASRKEFMTAVTLIAQAQDVEYNTRQFTKSAAAGFLALQEASDFVGNGLADVDVSRLVAGHRTPVLKQIDVSDMPPTIAAQHYYNYAKEHLAAGVGPGPVGSIALYGLAKIIVAGAGRNSQQLQYTGPAMALYQAALICEPQNFRAAHELGVLLAGAGQLELAREMLLGSTIGGTQPTMWKNLAVVHARLGEQQMAAHAQQKAEILEQTSPKSDAPPVQWVDPATFASLAPANDPMVPPTPMNARPSRPAGVSAPAQAPVKEARTRNWFNPFNLRR